MSPSSRARSSSRAFVAVAAALSFAACANHHARPTDFPPLSSGKRTAAEGTADVSVSLVRVVYRYEQDGTYTSTLHDTFTVLTPDGVEGWSGTSARWSPWHMDRPVIRATITSPGGAESRLQPSALSEAAAYPEAPAIYGDERVLRGPLPNVGVGSVVDEEIVTRWTKPFIGRAEAHTLLFQVGAPRQKVELVIDLPESMPLRYAIREAKVAVSDVRTNGRRIVSFTGGPYEPLKALEPSTPSNVVSWPHVSFTTGSAWRPLASEYARIVREKTADRVAEDLVAKIVAPTDSPTQKADKILAWVRDRVRYVGVEFGESSIVPRAPSETLRQGYGDCKDQAVLVFALLRAAGLPARVALVDSGDGEDIDAALPALNVFNHAIVVIPGASPVWMDPTATRARAGELPAGDQGRLALLVDDDTESLTRTPIASERVNTYREVREIFVSDRRGARVVERSTATGGIERGLRDTFAANAADKQKWLKKYVADTYSSQEPGRLEISNVDDLATPFAMSLEADNAQTSTGGLLTASVIAGAGAILGWIPRALVEGEERQNDFALAMPYAAELDYEIHPPEGFVLDEKPELPDVAMGPATLRRALEQRPDGVVVLRYRFVLPKSVWSAREVNELRKSYAEFADGQAPMLAFVHEGQKLHKARQIDKEVAVYRRDIARRPSDASAKMRLANALVEIGFGTTARALATEATKLSPNDRTLWGYAGYVRGRDALGRWEVPGWDYEGAIAAYREALRIEPSSAFAATQVALLLEHNAAGQRYGVGSRLEEAVATLDGVDPAKLAAYDGGDFVNNALFDLMWLGKSEEVRARVAKLDPKKTPAVPAIVASAMIGGASASLAEANRLRLPDESRASILERSADVLIAFRRYPEATALLEAAAQASSDERLRHRASIIRKTKKIDAAALPVARPEDVVRKVFALCSLHAPTLKDDLRPLVATSDDELATKAFREFCDGAGPNGDRRERFADLVAAMLELRADGSDTLGYRVSMSSGGESATFFVARERAGYQLQVGAFLPSGLGCGALAALKAGRKEAAAQWLAWAKELFTPSAGDDPLRDTPFLKLWTIKSDDAEIGAASLCAASGHPDLTAPMLAAARAKASGDRATALDHALALAYANGARDADAIRVASDLESRLPTSEVAWYLKRGALARLGRFTELRDAAASRAAKDPSNAERLLDLAIAEAQLGRFDAAYAAGERAVATNKAPVSAYNDQAWRSLFTGRVTDKDLEYALKAVNAAPNNVAYLNTLAAVEIALGRVADAREHFVRCIEQRPNKQPDASDWYVLGRIAEQLGLLDEARAAYAKIAPAEKWRGQYTSAHLAAERLRAMK